MNYGLVDIWGHGDAISHAIAFVLIIMSLLSWAVMFYKGMQLARLKKQSGIVERRFWQAETLEAGTVLLGKPGPGNLYQKLVEAALDARTRHSDTNLEEALSPQEWLNRCLSIAGEEQTARMVYGLGVLASIGSTAPFVGLFGTVWGIFHALMGISVAGQSSLAQVAGPVGESLVMTAFGLFVAIPAVLGYNALTRGNRGLMYKLARFRHELHAYLMSAGRGDVSPSTDKRAQPRLVVEGK
jgi:biopolymer transport protein ExbB